MNGTVQILEYVSSGGPLRVDREKGIIYGVKILGERSANPPPRNNEYPRATREKAIPLIEGSRSYVNHPAPQDAGKPRRYEEGIGVLRSVQEKGDGLFGNFHYNPKHALAEQIAWDAENAPDNLGFSINGNGRSSAQNGRQLVEEITVIHSVDLVSRGATTKSLFEGLEQLAMTMKTLKEVKESLPAGSMRRLTLQMLEDVGAPADMAAAPAAATPEDAFKEAGGKAWMAVWEQFAKDGDAATAKSKAADVLRNMAKLIGGDKPADKPADATEGRTQPNPKPGDSSLREELDQLKRENRAHRLCQEAKFAPTATQLKALVALPDEGDVKALIGELHGQRAASSSGGKPRSAERPPTTRVQESRTQPADVGQAPDDPKALATWLNS